MTFLSENNIWTILPDEEESRPLTHRERKALKMVAEREFPVLHSMAMETNSDGELVTVEMAPHMGDNFRMSRLTSSDVVVRVGRERFFISIVDERLVITASYIHKEKNNGNS